MVKRLLVLVLVLLGGAGFALAQEATEQFIPIGQSPGVSGKLSVIGEIDSYDESSRVLTVSAETGTQSVTLTDSTFIWLDRSGLKQANLAGASADLQKGRKVEVKMKEQDGQQIAEWVKVQAPAAATP
jgi:hypothetical protein